MTRHLLRIEAVNLASFVYDTPRLATVRGGSLLLLRAPGRVARWLEEDSRTSGVEILSAGASAGLFAFDAALDDGEILRRGIEEQLAGDPDLRHATFVVDVHPASEDFRRDVEVLMAKNRFRQARSLSVAWPSEPAPPAAGACEYDRIRPAVARIEGPGGTAVPVSASVAVRTRYGREQKRRFYAEETKQPADERMAFAFDFHEIAADPSQGKLDGKIAVLYFDGNDFGRLQREVCRTAALQREFDDYLLESRREMLRALLARIRERPEGWLAGRRGGRPEAFRFETLLWGGDEWRFVVPAWKGWELLGEIQRQVAAWSFRGEVLSFAAGLAFCHAKAPIRRITDLTERLAGEAKAVSRAESLVAYQVLESFDLVSGDLATFRTRRSPAGDGAALLVRGGDVVPLGEALGRLRSQVPRKRLYDAVTRVLTAPSEAAAETVAAELWTAAGLTPADRAELAARCRPAAAVVHLAELWDYLPEEEPA